ncbi:hypothetical protein BGZ73_008062 [Actinomortierella ambigua]|nr:hypothetical protein BGZ73_008062 [Actinomortierella ambigua]
MVAINPSSAVDVNRNSLTVIDNRTGKIFNIPITNNSVPATAFKAMKTDKSEGRDEDESTRGIRVYDPSYQNTAVCRSSISYIDGDNGILRYRGYPIEELAEKSSFLEVAFLLIYGELPNKVQFKQFEHEVLHHTFVHTNASQLMKSFNYDAHPMGMFVSGIAALSTFHPEANPALVGSDLYTRDDRIMNKQIFRLLGKAPTIAAMSYRHRIGREFNHPVANLGYAGNFLQMMDRLTESNYVPHPKLTKALDILFILHADHEINCSTAAMRHVSSSLVDPYSAVSSAAASLYGNLHGGANAAVIKMLEEIGTVDRVPEFIERVKAKETKLFGFGHRIYKSYDPRSKIIKKVAYEVFEVCGREELIDVAVALEEASLKDDYFIKRRLYPNVDFFSGLIYKAMGFPTDFFPVLFAIPRVAGWLAHWREGLHDSAQKIWRPRQLYVGEAERPYVDMEDRNDQEVINGKQRQPLMETIRHPFSKRRAIATYDGKSKL